MSPRLYYGLSSIPGFIADPESIDQNQGRQIDWASVTAAYQNASGIKQIKAGTVMAVKGGTNGKIFPRALAAAGETAFCILLTDAIDDSVFNRSSLSQASTGFGCLLGGVVFENMLPDAAGGPPKTLPAAYKAELNAVGVGSFRWLQYEDVRS